VKVSFLCALALGLAVALAPGAAVGQASDTDAKPAKEKKICRSYKVTGSLTRKTRICRTEAEWKESDAATYKGVSDMQGSASGAGRCIGLNCDAAPGM
jgi:ABC-type sugar transport system substrate-binding protein